MNQDQDQERAQTQTPRPRRLHIAEMLNFFSRTAFKTATPMQKKLARFAFFSGAYAVFSLLTDTVMVNPTNPGPEQIAVMDDLWKEIQAFKIETLGAGPGKGWMGG